ncbi:MAG: glutathione S-transferase [Saprospiraceae bacterium]|jgi:glutathione S-transferase
MDFQLYYAEGSAAMHVRTLLEELNLFYDLREVSIEMDEERPADMLKYNPNGWVPVLVWGEKSMYECGAITTFLCDRNPEMAMAPNVVAEMRGEFHQWLFYFSSSIQNAFQMSYYPFRFCNSKEDEASVTERAQSRLRETFTVVDDAMADRKWVLGDQFGAVDLYLFMLTTWLDDSLGHPSVEDFPNIHRITQQVMLRPSVQKVYANYIKENG